MLLLLLACSEEERAASEPQIQEPPILLVGARAIGIAIESGGKTALITVEDGSRLSRANLVTGDLTIITDWTYPPLGYEWLGRFSGIAIESGGTTTLITTTNIHRGSIHTGGELMRVDLITGNLKVIATGFHFPRYALGLAIEEGGKTALVADMCNVTRVNLNDGAKVHIAEIQPCTDPSYDYDAGPDWEVALVIESSRETALLLYGGILSRVNLLTGKMTLLTGFMPLLWSKTGLALEPSGKTALVTMTVSNPYYLHPGGLLRVDLDTGEITTVRKLGSPLGVAVEEGGKTALVGSMTGVWRVKLVP